MKVIRIGMKQYSSTLSREINSADGDRYIESLSDYKFLHQVKNGQYHRSVSGPMVQFSIP